MTIGAGADSVALQVYELNDTRLKIGVTVPTAGGFKYIVFLFKKK
ncbi:hypothetical protein [Parapedobacter sp. ISTM3]|nr:hypothetical protein [Parapedobacter sp. ISTM3]